MAWLPNQVPGLAAWFDSSDLTTITATNNLVNSWADKSGNNRNATQVTESNQPTLIPGDGISFTTNTTLAVSNAEAIARNIGYRNGFIVYYLTTTTSAQRSLFYISRNDTGVRSGWYGRRTAGLFPHIGGRRTDADVFQQVGATSYTVIVNVPLIFNGEFVYSDGVCNLFVNGTQTNSNTAFQTAGLTSDTNSAAVNIGNNPGLTESLVGVIKEIIIYSGTTVSANSRQKIEGYLAWKWGLQSTLPSTHPYINSPPYASFGLPINPWSELILTDTSVQPGTITLSSVTALPGRVLTFKDIRGSWLFSTLTLSTSINDVFDDGGTQKILREPFGFLKIQSDGVNKWNLLDGTQMNTFTFSTLLNSRGMSTLNISSIQIQASTLVLEDQANTNTSNLFQRSTLLYLQDQILAGTRAGPVLTLPTTRFNPLQISGSVLWLDAADPDGTGVLPASGTAVSTWKDKSGSNNDAVQGTAGNRPVFTFDSGLPSVSFTRASAQYMTGPGIMTSLNYGIFVVYRTLSPATLQYVFFDYKKSTGGTGQNYIQFLINANNRTGGIVYSETPLTNKTMTTPANTSPIVLSCIDTPGNNNSNFFVTGTQLTTTFTNGGVANINTDAFGYTLGTLRTTTVNTTNSFNGFYYEVLIYLNQPTQLERQQIEGYLAWKWGLQGNLPLTHPYYYGPP